MTVMCQDQRLEFHLLQILIKLKGSGIRELLGGSVESFQTPPHTLQDATSHDFH